MLFDAQSVLGKDRILERGGVGDHRCVSETIVIGDFVINFRSFRIFLKETIKFSNYYIL